MMGNVYALIRVSTKKQNEERQVIEMTKLGVPKSNIIIEKESGKSTARTKYKRLVSRLRSGDTLYIENIDRLARDYDTILREWHYLTKEKGVIIKVIHTPALNSDQTKGDLASKFNRDILLLVQAFQAENEWQKIKSRQAQGIAVAKANGKKLGRPKATISEVEIKIVKQYENGEITFDTALSLLKLKKTAFYKLYGLVKDIE